MTRGFEPFKPLPRQHLEQGIGDWSDLFDALAKCCFATVEHWQEPLNQVCRRLRFLQLGPFVETPAGVGKLGLGPLIGTRTWGGLIGISGNPSLADGGSILASTFRFMDTDNEWAVENEGVSPDIEVVDRPELVAAGKDPTLEEAVKVLLEELEKTPPVEVKAPPSPTEF